MAWLVEKTKEYNKTNVTLKSAKKEIQENRHEHQKVTKKNEDTIEELLAFKVMRSSEEKSFKSKQKKLDKKIRKVEETETKLKQTRSKIPNNFYANENETNNSDQSREILSHIVPLIPTHNPFQVLEPTILQTNSLDTDNLDPTSLETSTILEPTSLPIALLDTNT